MQTGTPIGGKQLWIVVDFTLTYASINGARQRANVNLSFAALSLQPLFDRSRLQAILFFSFLFRIPERSSSLASQSLFLPPCSNLYVRVSLRRTPTALC